MPNVAVIGAQWGDEGKGKIVDWLSKNADVVVRFQGGHNAGHTLVIDGTTYKLSLLPSGIVRPNKLSMIGNGVVVDPWAFLDEVERVRAQGITISPNNLVVAENAPLILPLHRELDAFREASNARTRIGTTKRGIGPAYEDKVGRRAIRVIDLADFTSLADKVEDLLAHHNALRRGFGHDELNVGDVLRSLKEVAPKILPFADRVWRRLHEEHKRGRKILFEGAQGALLDVDHGTYPYVTSSNTVAGNAAAGTGLGPQAVGYVLGITKAYTTRVGEGPFPSELTDAMGEFLGNRGREFGTVTGRKRRCGWFDAVLVRQTVMTAGISGLAFTKMDVLDELETIKIAVGYELDGVKIDYLPTSSTEQKRCKPLYETVDGWRESTRGVRDWKRLPAAAQNYVRLVEREVGAKVAILSTSPERDDAIVIEHPFEAREAASATPHLRVVE